MLFRSGGWGLLIGEQLGEGEAGVVVDGDMQGLPAEVGTARTATPAIATNGNPLETGHSLDVEMQQISGTGVLIALHRGSGVEIAPATEMGAAEDAADGGRTQSGGVGDVIGGTLLAPQFDDALAQPRGSGARTAPGARTAIAHAGSSLGLITADPLAGSLGADFELGCSRVQSHPLQHHGFGQSLSTARRKSGILVNVHSVAPRKLDCSAQSASLVPIEWTTS